jgi:hypothetical protein
MKNLLFFLFFICQGLMLPAEIVEKTFYFNNYVIETKGSYQIVNFGNTSLSGIPGEPLLPWHELVLMLPPGEAADPLRLSEKMKRSFQDPSFFILNSMSSRFLLINPLILSGMIKFISNQGSIPAGKPASYSPST